MFFLKRSTIFFTHHHFFFCTAIYAFNWIPGGRRRKKVKNSRELWEFLWNSRGWKGRNTGKFKGLWRFWWNSREWKEKTPGICITTHLNKVKFIFLLLAEMICTLDFFSASLFVKRQKIEASRVTPPVAPKTSEVKVPLSICCIRLYTFFCAFYRLQSVCQ